MWTTKFFELFPEVYIERNLCQEAGWVYFLLFTYVFSFCKKRDFGLIYPYWIKPVNTGFQRQESWGLGGKSGVLVVSECRLGFSDFLLLLRCCRLPTLQQPHSLISCTSFIHSLEITAVMCAEFQGIESDLSCHEKGIWWIQDGLFGTGLIFILGKIIAVPY